MSESIFFSLLSFATSGLSTLLSVGLAVVGLVYVRRVHALASICFVASGALGAFGSVIRRLVSLAFSFTRGTPIFTISQVLTSLLSVLAGALIPVAIFLLATAIKEKTRPNM